MKIKDKKFELYNGVMIPAIGFGTWQVSNEDAYTSVMMALEAGYRHIDTAYIYENEEGVAKAIKDFNIAREEIFITTKLPADIKNYDDTISYFYKSLNNLDTEYIDLFLIHAPWPWSDVGQDYTSGNIEAWKAMIKLYNEGKIKAIGVSNFHKKDIEALIEATNFKPMVNQIRYFIGNTLPEITTYCQENNILIEAYSPLATGALLENEIVLKMAEKYNTTLAKICLRFCIQNNTLPLPKSTHKERIEQNLDVDFEIEKEDMDYLNSLKHIGPTRPYRS